MTFRRALMVAGFLAAAAGDWLLAVKGSPRGTFGFLGGVAAFSVAQLLWTAAHAREARPDLRAFVALAVPLALFVGVRLWPVLNPVERAAISLYALIGPFSLSMAWATRRLFYLAGAALLLVSDVMIGLRWLGVPGASPLVGPLYLMSEAAMLVSAFWRTEPRRKAAGESAAGVACATVALAGGCFVLAGAAFPGGCFDPCQRMLSALGRTEVGAVAYPWSHFLFVAGMFASVGGIVAIARRRGLSPWGTALNAGGLVTIALVPEDVCMYFHNAGCWLATAGGGLMLGRWFVAEPSRRVRLFWAGLLVLSLVAIGGGLALHAVGVVRFAPWVPTAQKGVILSFAAWLFIIAVRCRAVGGGVRDCASGSFSKGVWK